MLRQVSLRPISGLFEWIWERERENGEEVESVDERIGEEAIKGFFTVKPLNGFCFNQTYHFLEVASRVMALQARDFMMRQTNKRESGGREEWDWEWEWWFQEDRLILTRDTFIRLNGVKERDTVVQVVGSSSYCIQIAARSSKQIK